MDDVLFIPGDMYIIGIAPVHNLGSSPLKCGTIKPGYNFNKIVASYHIPNICLKCIWFKQLDKNKTKTTKQKKKNKKKKNKKKKNKK